MLALLFLLAVGTSSSCAANAPAKADPASIPAAAQVDALFARWDSTASPGCAVAVMQDGRIVHERGYGMANLEHGVPITPDTVFHIASISKQFTAAAIVLLAQEGRLSLDDPVRRHVPELPDFGAPVTIRQLIHHTSGLRDQWAMLELAGWRYSHDLITDDDVLSIVSRQKQLNFPPSSQYSYSNTGYTLLAQIARRVSGRTFRELTTERIFRPLGMRSTHFRDDFTEIVPGMAYGYRREGDVFKLSVTNFDTVGATSLLTTVRDLLHWDENFYDPVVGGAAFVRQMLEQGVLEDGRKIDYAFGLRIGSYRGLPTVEHSGADAGYRADLLRFPGQHFSVACLCNIREARPGDLAARIADIYLAPELAPVEAAAPTVVQLPVAELQSAAGTYLNRDEGEVYRIILQDGKLRTVEGEDPRHELVPVGKGRFRVVAAGPVTELAFSAASAGRPAGMTAVVGDGEAEAYERVADFSPTRKQLEAYTGIYGSEELEARYRIVLQDGVLSLSSLKSKPEPLQPVTRDTFIGDVGGVYFARDRLGRITGFSISAGRIRNVHFDRLGPLRE